MNDIFDALFRWPLSNSLRKSVIAVFWLNGVAMIVQTVVLAVGFFTDKNDETNAFLWTVVIAFQVLLAHLLVALIRWNNQHPQNRCKNG